jgi:hypothetical protein
MNCAITALYPVTFVKAAGVADTMYCLYQTAISQGWKWKFGQPIFREGVTHQLVSLTTPDPARKSRNEAIYG